jgi:S1-C subfamily serine protease
MKQTTQGTWDFSGAADQAEGALVHLTAACRRGATGSVFDDSGVIVTTARAVAGRERLTVLQGAQTVEAAVLGFDTATDIGVARAETPLGKAPAWAPEPAALGSPLLIGSRPGRSLRVRLGVVSQVGPVWHTPRGGRVERYLETDVTPEPGFSGGLAFDAQGRALGMNAAGLVRGAALLLERATLERVVSEIVTHGQVRRGYLGVATLAVRLPDAARPGDGQPSGLLVSSVQPGSAAERAGLLLGDVLLGLGGTQLVDARALQVVLEDVEDRALPLELLRAGQKLVVEVTPGVRP